MHVIGRGSVMFILSVMLFTSPGTSYAGGQDITVYKSAQCDCCGKWADYLMKNGFHVVTRVVSDSELDKIKANHGVTRELSSCHTAMIDGYVIEGHVPADVIQRMLKERPKIVGLTAPGMPKSAPGMDEPGEPYNILTFDSKGKTTIYTSR
jgi:hypothetical protein